jgi:hypothetical protein
MQLIQAGSALSARRAVHLALRWVLGLTLLATSVGKALDIPGFHDVLSTYDIFPGWSLWLVAVAMPIIEAGIAATMLSGKRLGASIIASLLLHSSFAVLLTIELARGLHLENCGCFGVFLARPLMWYTPLEDVALVAITLGIAVTYPLRAERRPQSSSAKHPCLG